MEDKFIFEVVHNIEETVELINKYRIYVYFRDSRITGNPIYYIEPKLFERMNKINRIKRIITNDVTISNFDNDFEIIKENINLSVGITEYISDYF